MIHGHQDRRQLKRWEDEQAQWALNSVYVTAFDLIFFDQVTFK